MAEIINVSVSPSHAVSPELPCCGILNVSLNIRDCFRTPGGVVVPISSYPQLHTSIYFPHHLLQHPQLCRLHVRDFFLSEPFSGFGLPSTVTDCLASYVLDAASAHTLSFYLNAEVELLVVVGVADDDHDLDHDHDDHYDIGDHDHNFQFIDDQLIIDDQTTTRSRSTRTRITRAVDRLNMTSHERVVVGAEDDQNNGDGCCICLEEFSAGTEFLRFGCKHVYHQNCIVKWLEKQNTCPLCRRPL